MTDYRHDIEKYLNGELTPAERNALERKALNDPFLADALEGAEQLPANDFANDVAVLNEKIAAKKIVSVWMWSARIAAGFIILLVSSYLVWTFLNPEPVQDLVFEKSEPESALSTPADSVNPSTGALSAPAEQPSAGPSNRDKDVASQTTYPSKADENPKPEAGESILKNEPVADAIVAETKTEAIKAEEIPVTEPVAVAKSVEKEEEVSRAKAFDDMDERKVAKKKDAVPAAGDKSDASGFASIPKKVIRGQVTSYEDGSPLTGVNVVIKNSTIGTVTDVKGNYQITTNDASPTLVYSFIGLQSTEVKTDKQEVDVQMSLDVAQLSEIVVTGSGVQSEETLPPTVDLAHPEIGNRAFKQYLEKSIRYPEQAKANKVSGRVTVEFTIEPNGTLTNFTIVRGIGSGCDEELIRLIKEGPKWIPTKKDNISVEDKAKVGLRFKLPK